MKQAPRQRHDARGLRVALLRARFNAAVVDGLVDGALAALEEMGAKRAKVDLLDVPGSFELPLAALTLARSGRYAGMCE